MRHIAIIAKFAKNRPFKLIVVYLGKGGGATGRGGNATLIPERRLTTPLRARTTGTGGFFKCNGLRGGGGGGNWALASANVHEAITAINNVLIVFIVVGLIY